MSGGIFEEKATIHKKSALGKKFSQSGRSSSHYPPKAKWTLMAIYLIYLPIFTEPEANNCFSIILRGKYQELQNNGLKHRTTDAVLSFVFSYEAVSSFTQRVRHYNKQAKLCEKYIYPLPLLYGC